MTVAPVRSSISRRLVGMPLPGSRTRAASISPGLFPMKGSTITDCESAALTEAVDMTVNLLKTGKPDPPTYKTDRDLANELDERTEREVKKLFARRTPDIPFLGKESSSVGPSGTYWCLDPIGRTLNFTQGIPMYATPLALVRDGVPNIGR